MKGPRPQQLEVGVTYFPASVGPYLWHEFDAPTVARDFAAIAARRFTVVRVLLSWDAFMPSDRAPLRRRVRDLETLLNIARDTGIRVVPTLFAQTIGGCILLPSYAIDRRAPRRGVRCVTDGRVVEGGPRDAYADPLMLETQVRWLDGLLAAFAGHPSVAAWDLGHDPATGLRPRRVVDLTAWTELMAGRMHAQGELCRLTLGQADVTSGRAVRLGALSPHLDLLGLAVQPQRLRLPGDPLDGDRVQFLVALAQALAGPAVPLVVELGIASGELAAEERLSIPADSVTATPGVARRATDEILERLHGGGVAGIFAAAWSDWSDRLREAPPVDRRPWWANLGIVDNTGGAKDVAAPWTILAAHERAVSAAQPFPDNLDVEAYYANLPDSLLDLHASWQRDHRDAPAILE